MKEKKEVAAFLNQNELHELKYCINKELAWKRTQLLQLKSGITNNMTEKGVPEKIGKFEHTQEEWIQEKITILEKALSKIKALLVEKRKEAKQEEALKILETVDPVNDDPPFVFDDDEPVNTDDEKKQKGKKNYLKKIGKNKK